MSFFRAGKGGGGDIPMPDEYIVATKAGSAPLTFTFTKNVKRVIIVYSDYYNGLNSALIMKDSSGTWKRLSYTSSTTGTKTESNLIALPSGCPITETSNSVTMTGEWTSRTVLLCAMGWYE